VFTIPGGDVKNLPKIFFINHRLDEEALHDKVAREGETKCDHCAGKEPNLAMVLCRDCGTLLCDYCYGYHKSSKEYQNHTVTSLHGLKANQKEGISLKVSVAAICQEHDMVLNCYCETCELLVCHYCIIKSHHSHDHDTVKKMADKHRKELDKVMEPVLEMVNGLSATCNQVCSIVDEIEIKANDVEREIDKYFQWFQQQLQQQKEQLKKELHNASIKKKKEFSIQQQLLEGTKGELESLKELNDVIKKGTYQDTLLMRKEVVDDIKRLSDCYKEMDRDPVESAAMEFVPVKIYEESLPRFGKIYASGYELSVIDTYALEGKVTGMASFTIAPNKHLKFDQIHAQAHSIAGSMKPTKINLHRNGLYSFVFTGLPVGEMSLSVAIKGQEVKGSPFRVVVGRNYTCIDQPLKMFNADGKLDHPWGIAFTRNGTWAVSDDSNHCVWVFDSYDELITMIGTKGDNASQFQRPLGVAFDSSNHLYVVDHYNHRVQKFDINGCFLLQFGNQGSANEKLRYPIGIAVHKGIVYVTDHGNSRVSVFDCDGQFCGIIGSPKQLQHPYGVVCINNLLLVADWGLHSIFQFTLSGECVGKIGVQGTDKGQLNRPSGLITDTCGFILVTEDYNSRVSVFDKDGGFLHYFGAEGSKDDQLLNPKGIAISPTGAIYVTDYNKKRIQIFSKY